MSSSLTTTAKKTELQYSAYGTTCCCCLDVLLANFEPFNTFLIMACSHFYETFLSSSSGSSCKRGMAFNTLHSDPQCWKMTQKSLNFGHCERSEQKLFPKITDFLIFTSLILGELGFDYEHISRWPNLKAITIVETM